MKTPRVQRPVDVLWPRPRRRVSITERRAARPPSPPAASSGHRRRLAASASVSSLRDDEALYMRLDRRHRTALERNPNTSTATFRDIPAYTPVSSGSWCRLLRRAREEIGVNRETSSRSSHILVASGCRPTRTAPHRVLLPGRLLALETALTRSLFRRRGAPRLAWPRVGDKDKTPPARPHCLLRLHSRRGDTHAEPAPTPAPHAVGAPVVTGSAAATSTRLDVRPDIERRSITRSRRVRKPGNRSTMRAILS